MVGVIQHDNERMVRAAKLKRLTVTFAELVGGAKTMSGIMNSPGWADLHKWEEDAIRRAEVALVRLEIEVDNDVDGITADYKMVFKGYQDWDRRRRQVTSGAFHGEESTIRCEMEALANDASDRCRDLALRARRYVRQLHDANHTEPDLIIDEPLRNGRHMTQVTQD